MKLNVSPNPGWTHQTVGKLDTWQDLANTGGNAATVYSEPWESSSATLGNVGITVEWSGAVANDVYFDLYGTYDGTNYTILSSGFGTKLESDGSGHVGKRIFARNVDGELKQNWSWPLHQVLSILKLGMSGACVMNISDQGALQISIDSGLAVYNYILPAMNK